MQQRLGWLLVAWLLTMKLVPLQNSRALPIEPAKLASELKVNSHIIRVRLSNLGNEMTIKGNGLAVSLAKKPELGNIIGDEWEVDCKRSRIIQPSTRKSRDIPRSGILVEALSGAVSVNGKRFRDQIVIYPKELLSPYDESVRNNSECLVVNHLEIEKYLESVVNGEFNSQWAQPAVEAQIIAARTYAVYQMKEMRKDHGRVFDVESTQKDQVYLGLDVADSKGAALVAKTRGMVMMDHVKACPIKAFYHASCGGGTFLPKEIWGASNGGFKKVKCPYCAGSPSFQWNYALSFRDIEKRIVRGLQNDPGGRKYWPKSYIRYPHHWILNNVRITRSGDRVDHFIFDFQGALNATKILSVVMNAYQARNWLDAAQLKSVRFDVTVTGRLATFHGKGSGHSVGLCQWGAKKMGEIGFTRDQILTHYYPQVKIAKLW